MRYIIRSIASFRSVSFLLLAFAIGTGPLAAQTGMLFVRVQSPTGPLANARVEVLLRGTVVQWGDTDELGAVRIGGIPVGTFSVKIQALGYREQVREGVRISPGTAVPLEVSLELAPIELEGLTIRTERVQIRRENTEFQTTVEEEAILLLPMKFDTRDLVALTPGARPGHIWGGANLQANNYRIDGLSANHPGLGGDLLQPSLLWIDRLDVRGLGAGAEYGGFQGGMVDVTTKSGDNRFQGNIRTLFETDLLTGTNLVNTEIGTETAGRQGVEGEVRGPLIRDRLFYYASAKYLHDNKRALNHLDLVDGRYAPFQQEDREQKLFGKLTWTPGPSHLLELSGAYTDTRAENYGITGYETGGAAHRYSSPTWFVNGSFREILGSSAVLEARINHFSRDERYLPYEGQDIPGISTYTLTPPFSAFANAPLTLRSAPTSTAITASGNFRFTTGGLEHGVKVGGEYTRGGFLDQRIRNGGMTWMPVNSSRFDPEDPSTWTHLVSNSVPSLWGGEVHLDADVLNAAAYAQGSFSLGSRIVLTPGIRWNQWKGWITPTSGDRFLAVEDQGWDPRLGLSVDITSDGLLVAKAHWGRYHQNMISQMFDRVEGADVFTNQEYWYYRRGDELTDPSTTFTEAERDALAAQGGFTKFGEEILNETGPVMDYKQPYVDQWLVALEKQVGDWLKFEAIYTQRSNKDMVSLVDLNREYNYVHMERVRVFDGTGSIVPYEGGSVYLQDLYVPNYTALERIRCKVSGDCDEAPMVPGLTYADSVNLTWDPLYVLTTAPDGKREFKQFQLNIEVAYPNFGGSFSFVHTDLKGNLDNVSGYTDPAGYGAGPYVRVNEGVNAYGTLENFSEREWKVSAWGMLPWELRGGAFWTFRSGDHYSPRFRLYGLGFFEYRVNTGALRPGGTPERAGDEVDYQLLWPLEGHNIFIGPRGLPTLEGQSILDVRLERMFQVQGYDLSVSLDVFNLLRNEAITKLNTMVNNGPDYGFKKSYSLFVPEIDPNTYYQAPLERVPPQTFRLGMAVYF